MTFIRRLMEIKEEQLYGEKLERGILCSILNVQEEILKVLKGGKDGKRKQK